MAVVSAAPAACAALLPPPGGRRRQRRHCAHAAGRGHGAPTVAAGDRRVTVRRCHGQWAGLACWRGLKVGAAVAKGVHRPRKRRRIAVSGKCCWVWLLKVYMRDMNHAPQGPGRNSLHRQVKSVCSGQLGLGHASKHTRPGLQPPPTAIGPPCCSLLLRICAGDALSQLCGCIIVEAIQLIAGQASGGRQA